MAEETKVRDNVEGRHNDGLWPDFDASAESSVHENLPNHFGDKDNLFPDPDLSVQSVEDGAKVLAEHGFGKDELHPDAEASEASVQEQVEFFADEDEKSEPKKKAAKKTASKKSDSDD